MPLVLLKLLPGWLHATIGNSLCYFTTTGEAIKLKSRSMSFGLCRCWFVFFYFWTWTMKFLFTTDWNTLQINLKQLQRTPEFESKASDTCATNYIFSTIWFLSKSTALENLIRYESETSTCKLGIFLGFFPLVGIFDRTESFTCFQFCLWSPGLCQAQNFSRWTQPLDSIN